MPPRVLASGPKPCGGNKVLLEEREEYFSVKSALHRVHLKSFFFVTDSSTLYSLVRQPAPHSNHNRLQLKKLADVLPSPTFLM